MEIDLNQKQQNLETCLKSISNFGSTTYQNICTGGFEKVVWGSSDWVFYTTLLIVLIGVYVFILTGLIVFIKELISD